MSLLFHVIIKVCPGRSHDVSTCR